MQENKLFEALLDVIPFAAYAVDIDTYEVVYMNKKMSEKIYAPRENFCWKKIYGQEEVCSWCSISELRKREMVYKSEKLVSEFFDESSDSWFQSYDELVKWPDGRTVKYCISVDITKQKDIQADMIKTHTKLAIQSKKLQEANKKLNLLANQDFLTNINNRRNFFKLAKEIFNDQKNSEKIYTVMFDIDNFKSINDTYGHSTGDEILKIFCQTVEKRIKADCKDAVFGRLGGEEFSIILVDNNFDDVLKLVEDIVKDVESIEVASQEQAIKFTVSAGLVKKQKDETIDQTLQRADEQLYDAKTTGKNRLKFRV